MHLLMARRAFCPCCVDLMHLCGITDALLPRPCFSQHAVYTFPKPWTDGKGLRGGAWRDMLSDEDGMQGRVRSLALAWEQARAALQERQNSARNTPQTSPRDQDASVPTSPSLPSGTGSPGAGQPGQHPPLPPSSESSPGHGRSRHGRSQSVPHISPCDSAYDAADTWARQQEEDEAAGASGEQQPYVNPRSQSEAFMSPTKGGVERSAASDGNDKYYRHPPVSSVGLAKLQVHSSHHTTLWAAR